jgi:hypothetical protein
MSSSIFSRVLAHTTTLDPALASLCQLIPRLGVKSRKAILDVCQTARTADVYPACAEALKAIAIDFQIRPHVGKTSLPELEEQMYRVASFPIYRSFVSMLVRSEPLDMFSEADEVILQGFEKEFGASQTEREEELRISYQCLDQDNYHPTPYSVFYDHPTPAWASFARHFVEKFASKLDRLGILFPQVQRVKNMSQESCWQLHEAGYRVEGRDWKDFRTLDLELMAYQTGIRTGGDCEMRYAWKFNELKPRFYYCVGASQYWSARWVKNIAIEMMETVPSTRLKRRQHPEDIQNSLQDDDYLAIWDMTSFTSSLSELKHFLWYIAKNMEENIRIRQNPLKCLDYADGIIEIPAYDLLLQYNETVNVRAPFSIWRVLDKLMGQADEWERFEQKNSGMLGVQGNIGFSTAFHGFHIEAGIRPGTGCGLGDDALGGMGEDPKKRFFPHMRLIGDLQDEKGDVLPPLTEAETEQVSKFIKRRFVRTHMGIEIWFLFAFPGLADVFELRDEYHTIQFKEKSDRALKFIGQCGAFLWSLHETAYLEFHEYELIRRVLGVAYRRLGLDPAGSLPGRKHRDFIQGIPLSVPPLYIDWAAEDWAEWLWDHSVDRWALLPTQLGPILMPPYESGLVFTASEGGLVNLLEDVGCVEKIRMITEWVEVTVTNKRVYRSCLAGATRSYICRFRDVCPHWYSSVFKFSERVPTNYGM